MMKEPKRTVNIYVCMSLMEIYRSSAVHRNRYHVNMEFFIYSDFKIDLPADIMSHLKMTYQIQAVKYDQNYNQGIKRFTGWSRHAKQICAVIKYVSRHYFRVNLLLFHDNWAFFPAIIEDFTKIKNASEIILLEDGISLYNPYRKTKERHLFIKKMLFRVLGLSAYALTSGGIGWNKHLSVILCQNPDDPAFEERRKCVPMKYEGPMFTKESLASFMLKLGIPQQLLDEISAYDYIFLTQPMEEAVGSRLYLNITKEVLSCFQGENKIVIKKHPRDQQNYEKWASKNVSVCDESLNAVPAECLINYLSGIHVLTFSSSAGFHMKDRGKSIFLFRLLNDRDYTSFMETVIHSGPDVCIVNDIEELKKLITELNLKKSGG